MSTGAGQPSLPFYLNQRLSYVSNSDTDAAILAASDWMPVVDFMS